MRARITRELIERKGFTLVAVEARLARRGLDGPLRRGTPPRRPPSGAAFRAVPALDVAEREVAEFVEWLRAHNADDRERAGRVGFYGLDLYSMYGSIGGRAGLPGPGGPGRGARWRAPATAASRPGARARRPTGAPRSRGSAPRLRERGRRRCWWTCSRGGSSTRSATATRFFDAAQNARLVANAERYYRAMYYGSVASWNLRDQHMFDTLARAARLPRARAPARSCGRTTLTSATPPRPRWARAASTTSASSAAARSAPAPTWSASAPTTAPSPRRRDWDEPMEVMARAARPPGELRARVPRERGPGLPARLAPAGPREVREELVAPRLERAIGVVYRPETELPATTSRPRCRSSSTSTSGSTGPRR